LFPSDCGRLPPASRLLTRSARLAAKGADRIGDPIPSEVRGQGSGALCAGGALSRIYEQFQDRRSHSCRIVGRRRAAQFVARHQVGGGVARAHHTRPPGPEMIEKA
jgi:hypothetical protein